MRRANRSSKGPRAHESLSSNARKRYMTVATGQRASRPPKSCGGVTPTQRSGIFCDDPNPGYFAPRSPISYLASCAKISSGPSHPTSTLCAYRARVHPRAEGRPGPARGLCSGNPAPLRYDGLSWHRRARASAQLVGGICRGAHAAHDSRCTARGRPPCAATCSARGVGGGALGLEWTHALLERGIHVTLLERRPRFMPRALDAVASDLLSARCAKPVSTWCWAKKSRGPNHAERRVGGNRHEYGRRIACRSGGRGARFVPNSELLEQSGVERTPGGAVKVDAHSRRRRLRWAAGDVASVDAKQLGLWEPARHRAASQPHMCGAKDHSARRALLRHPLVRSRFRARR